MFDRGLVAAEDCLSRSWVAVALVLVRLDLLVSKLKDTGRAGRCWLRAGNLLVRRETLRALKVGGFLATRLLATGEGNKVGVMQSAGMGVLSF